MKPHALSMMNYKKFSHLFFQDDQDFEIMSKDVTRFAFNESILLSPVPPLFQKVKTILDNKKESLSNGDL